MLRDFFPSLIWEKGTDAESGLEFGGSVVLVATFVRRTYLCWMFTVQFYHHAYCILRLHSHIKGLEVIFSVNPPRPEEASRAYCSIPKT